MAGVGKATTSETIYGLEIPDEEIMEMFGRQIGSLTIGASGIRSPYRHPARMLKFWAGSVLPIHELSGFDEVHGMWRVSAAASLQALSENEPPQVDSETEPPPVKPIEALYYWDNFWKLEDEGNKRKMINVDRRDGQPELGEVVEPEARGKKISFSDKDIDTTPKGKIEKQYRSYLESRGVTSPEIVEARVAEFMKSFRKGRGSAKAVEKE